MGCTYSTAQLRPANPGWPRSSGCSNKTSRPKPRCLPPGPRLHLDKIPRQIMASVALEPRPRRETAQHSARLKEAVPCWFLSSTMCQTRLRERLPALPTLVAYSGANQRRGGWCRGWCRGRCQFRDNLLVLAMGCVWNADLPNKG